MVVYSLGTGTAILLPSTRSKRRLAATLTGNKAAVAFVQVIIKDEGVLVRLVNYEGYLSIAIHNGDSEHGGGRRFSRFMGCIDTHGILDNSSLTQTIDTVCGAAAANPPLFQSAENLLGCGIVAVFPRQPIQLRITLVDVLVWLHFGYAQIHESKI